MDLPSATAMLARTPRVLDAMLAELPAPWVHRDDGPGTWSAYDIVGHLLHADNTNWLPRIRTILRHGAGRAFGPFDRYAMLRWEREPVPALLDRLRRTREASVEELTRLNLREGDLARVGRHPEMGEVTLGQVVAAWVAHDLTHVAQAAEVLARRHRTDVGPYRSFMPALDRVAEAE